MCWWNCLQSTPLAPIRDVTNEIDSLDMTLTARGDTKFKCWISAMDRWKSAFHERNQKVRASENEGTLDQVLLYFMLSNLQLVHRAYIICSLKWVGFLSHMLPRPTKLLDICYDANSITWTFEFTVFQTCMCCLLNDFKVYSALQFASEFWFERQVLRFGNRKVCRNNHDGVCYLFNTKCTHS